MPLPTSGCGCRPASDSLQRHDHRRALRINKDGMVSVYSHLYSVPDSTRRRTVEVQICPKKIRIFEAGQRTAGHPVLRGQHKCSLDPNRAEREGRPVKNIRFALRS